jgi:protoporphyrinogen oxidase
MPIAPSSKIFVAGAGPAGLTAAFQLARQGFAPTVLEKMSQVGGISRTEVYKGYRFDIGGHRFYTKVDEVNQLWHAVMGDEFRPVSRLSRIYYNGHFYHYPLEPFNVLSNIGLIEGARMIASYCKARVRPIPSEDSLEEWVINRFGQHLYRTFFKSYTEKVWGIPCDQIRAEWAAQRIKGLSFISALKHALLKRGDLKTLINEFYYPDRGPGQMWERFATLVEQGGGKVVLETPVRAIYREGYRITAIETEQQGQCMLQDCDALISSMPLSELICRLDPPPPPHVLQAAQELRYRAFLTVGLIINRETLFPDNWLYIHSPQIRVGRIQNYKNWSTAMVPDPQTTSLGMEYFCDEGDELWTMPDSELIAIAGRELEWLELCSADAVIDGVVIRQPKAYPSYDTNYREHLDTIRAFLDPFENLQTIGRNGMHRYNNQDHAMLTGLLAAQNLLGGQHDLWTVNTERSYYEDFMVPQSPRRMPGPLFFPTTTQQHQTEDEAPYQQQELEMGKKSS